MVQIGMVATSQHVVVVNKNMPVINLRELMSLLRAQLGSFTCGSDRRAKLVKQRGITVE